MEWGKIEKGWKKKLGYREIIPSDTTWQKLTQQLEQEEKKVKKIVYKKWLSLVACLLVGGAIGWILIPSTSKSIENQSIQPFEENSFVDVNEINPNIIQNENSIEEKTASAEQIAIYEKEKTNLKIIQKETLRIAQINDLQDVEQVVENDNLSITKLIPVNIEKKEVIANRIVVDSNALLKQVEKEVEIEYRETKLKKIYETTKKVVVDISNNKYEK